MQLVLCYVSATLTELTIYYERQKPTHDIIINTIIKHSSIHVRDGKYL